MVQLAVFIRSADDKCNVTKDIALVQLEDTTQSGDRHKAVKDMLGTLSVVNMPGTVTGDAPELQTIVEGNSRTMQSPGLTSSLHETITHMKALKMDSVVWLVTDASHESGELNRQQFQEFLKTADVNYGDIICFSEERWLSQDQMSNDYLRHAVKLFIDGIKNKICARPWWQLGYRFFIFSGS